jgi:hypothetical protein
LGGGPPRGRCRPDSGAYSPPDAEPLDDAAAKTQKGPPQIAGAIKAVSGLVDVQQL